MLINICYFKRGGVSESSLLYIESAFNLKLERIGTRDGDYTFVIFLSIEIVHS